LRWNSSRSLTLYFIDLLDRLLQTGGRINFRRHHREQERMGVRILEVHHSMDHQERIHSPDYDEHEFDSLLLSDWDYFLVLWKDVQEVDEGLEGT
jgi:hypothetical protein